MKTPAVIVTLLLMAFAFSPAKGNTGSYSATLISPKSGAVLVPGQRVKVEWRANIPNPIDPSWCELEVFLSLDGGKSYPMLITPLLDPKATFFYWTVPNTPTKTAVLDIRFGCEPVYPESYSPQTASMFTIKQASGQLY